MCLSRSHNDLGGWSRFGGRGIGPSWIYRWMKKTKMIDNVSYMIYQLSPHLFMSLIMYGINFSWNPTMSQCLVFIFVACVKLYDPYLNNASRYNIHGDFDLPMDIFHALLVHPLQCRVQLHSHFTLTLTRIWARNWITSSKVVRKISIHFLLFIVFRMCILKLLYISFHVSHS